MTVPSPAPAQKTGDELAATTLDDVKAAFREWVEVTGVFPLDCGWFWECESFLDDVASLPAPSPAPAALVAVAYRVLMTGRTRLPGSGALFELNNRDLETYRQARIGGEPAYIVEALTPLTDAAAALSKERKRADAAEAERDAAREHGCPEFLPCARLTAYSTGDNKIMSGLRARADAAEAENFVLATNQCEGPMIGDEHGHSSFAKVTALTATVERLRAALQREIEAITRVRDNYLRIGGWDDQVDTAEGQIKALLRIKARAALQESTDG